MVCHSAHQSDHENLLTLPNKDLCISCHTEMGNLLSTAPYVHGPAAVDCSACHFSHGGDDRFFLRLAAGTADSATACTTDAATEGIRSFLEGREPNWP